MFQPHDASLVPAGPEPPEPSLSSSRIARALSSAIFFAILAGFVALCALASDTHAQSGRVVDHDYVGADRCRACHVDEHTKWMSSAHARAFDVLSPREQQDARCLSCHTTVADDTSAPLVGVQCEACHGPGRYYALDYVMRDAELRSQLLMIEPGEKTCARCHTESSPSLRPFSYPEKREAIRHWNDAPKPKGTRP